MIAAGSSTAGDNAWTKDDIVAQVLKEVNKGKWNSLDNRANKGGGRANKGNYPNKGNNPHKGDGNPGGSITERGRAQRKHPGMGKLE